MGSSCRAAVVPLPTCPIVHPPALGRAVVEQGASVAPARSDRLDATLKRADGDGRGLIAGSRVAELTEVVTAPTGDGARTVKRTGMVAACGYGDDAGKSADGDWNRTWAPRSVTELTDVVAAPALDCTGGEQRTGVMTACGDGDDAARQSTDRHGNIARIWRSVAELAVAVAAPAFDPAGAGHRAGVIAPHRDCRSDRSLIDRNDTK
jgi:hypothetical protein